PALTPDLDDPELYYSRELSWLDFNDRVLQIAEHERTPLLERAKFCAIYTSNLDEFFMIRVAGLHDQVDARIAAAGPDGLTPAQTLEGVRARSHELGRRLSDCLEDQILPALAEHGIKIVSWDDLDSEERAGLAERYQRQIFPVLTPLAVG